MSIYVLLTFGLLRGGEFGGKLRQKQKTIVRGLVQRAVQHHLDDILVPK